MNSTRLIRSVFTIAALYDGVLGLIFFVAGPATVSRFGLTPPSHWGHIHFPALLLIVFACMFIAVARRPLANRNLIPFGIFLKLSYLATVAIHWAAGLPTMYKVFAVADLLFAAVFLWAYARLGQATEFEPPGTTQIPTGT